jgi:hypothetical protein
MERQMEQWESHAPNYHGFEVALSLTDVFELDISVNHF